MTSAHYQFAHGESCLAGNVRNRHAALRIILHEIIPLDATKSPGGFQVGGRHLEQNRTSFSRSLNHRVSREKVTRLAKVPKQTDVFELSTFTCSYSIPNSSDHPANTVLQPSPMSHGADDFFK